MQSSNQDHLKSSDQEELVDTELKILFGLKDELLSIEGNLRTKFSKLHEDLTKAETNLISKTEDIKSTNEKILEFQEDEKNRLTQHSEQYDSLREELIQEKMNCQQKEAEVAQLTQTLAETNTELDKTKEQLQQQEVHLISLQEKLATMEQELSTTQQTLQQNQSKMSETDLENEQLKQTVVSLNNGTRK